MPIHIQAENGQVAPTVLLCGDPDRARTIAENHLTGVQCINRHRQLLGFTGRCGKLPITVQTTGMGAPSAAIVVEELIGLGARRLLRLGTCGAIRPGIALGDLIAVTAARGENGVTRELTGEPFALVKAEPRLAAALNDAAARLELPVHSGTVASLDLFYDPDPSRVAKLARGGVLALEMEASAVLLLATRHGLEAGCLLTVSDLVAERKRAPADVIATGVERMARVGLTVLGAG